jgi:hypothetical protein
LMRKSRGNWRDGWKGTDCYMPMLHISVKVIILGVRSFSISDRVTCCHALGVVWLYGLGFGLVTGFIGLAQFLTTIHCGAIAVSHTAVYYNMHMVLPVCCLFTSPTLPASNGRRSPSSGFPNCPRATATATLDSQCTLSNKSIYESKAHVSIVNTVYYETVSKFGQGS